jgi:hypothetical protein
MENQPAANPAKIQALIFHNRYSKTLAGAVSTDHRPGATVNTRTVPNFDNALSHLARRLGQRCRIRFIAKRRIKSDEIALAGLAFGSLPAGQSCRQNAVPPQTSPPGFGQ